jgi:predicted ATP-dependent endonuclease of OLD family
LRADVLSDWQAKIILIDEPELGLNPASKHEFLKFLFEQAGEKQIFMTTHDPTFVNPLLWNKDKVSVYLYSAVSSDFNKVDLEQNKQDPNTFAGYLPHTTSLKQVHIYVEGTTDVYIFQIFLDKYVKKNFKEDWYRILNKIGIYHLAGDFWSHLLYTIPRSPYSSIVILDGDKRQEAEKLVVKYGAVEADRFYIFHSPESLSDYAKENREQMITLCPVYCLKHSRIEDYLETQHGTEPLPFGNEPVVAYEMKHVPQEIEQLFDVIFQMANIKATSS